MKKSIQIIIICCLLSACEHDIFGPNRGNIQGTVVDNLNQPVEGVRVTSVFIEDEENQQTTEITRTTDSDGSYFFDDVLLTDHEISIEKAGLKKGYKSIRLTQENNDQTHDFILEGSPEISDYNIDNSTISVTNNEDAVITLSVTDRFNEDSTSTLFTTKCIVSKNENSIKILDLNLDSNSNVLFLFTATISATELQQGDYNISFEVIDPDGRITSEENIITLSVTN